MNNLVKKMSVKLENMHQALYDNVFEDKEFYAYEQAVKYIIDILNGNDYISLVKSNPMIDIILFELYDFDNDSVQSNYERAYIFDLILQASIKFLNSSTPERITSIICSGELSVNMLNENLLPHTVGTSFALDKDNKLHNAIINENIDRIKQLIIAYNKIDMYRKKENLSQEEYAEFFNLLTFVEASERLANLYINFCLEKNKKDEKIKEEPNQEKDSKEEKKDVTQQNIQTKPSNNELKKRLDELYHEPEKLKNQNSSEAGFKRYFDYGNIDEVLNIMKQLKYPDKIIQEIFSDLYKCAIKNENYYRYLESILRYLNENVDRYKGKYEEELEYINVWIKAYSTESDDVKKQVEEELDKLFGTLEEIFIQDKENKKAKNTLEQVLTYKMQNK